jgi:hypothetical protein
MSAYGTKRTWQARSPTSAFGGKADMAQIVRNVCFWHKADMPAALQCLLSGVKRTWAGRSTTVPELTPIHFPVCYFEPTQCLVLSLGEGDETALQSRRRTSQNATP